ncbi:MAG: hypothetical protein NTX57_15880 [Armatimonadetes bacterium]|nr:hypothetical protein [Armatimonadota bacterium]
MEAEVGQMAMMINGEAIAIYPVPVGLSGGPIAIVRVKRLQ